jgi:hypothetical protein
MFDLFGVFFGVATTSGLTASVKKAGVQLYHEMQN